MNTKSLVALTIACVVAVGCSESPTAPALAGSAESGNQAQHAPAISIVNGALRVDYTADPDGTAVLQGTHGFKLDAILWGGGLFPGRLCHGGFDCTPGTTIPLNGWWGDWDLPGTATLQGRTYEIGGASPPSASIEVTASIVAPPMAPTATLTTPFVLNGHLFLEHASHLFEGRGTATVVLRWNQEAWEVSSVRYEFRGRSGR